MLPVLSESKAKPDDVSVLGFINALDNATRRADAKTLVGLMKRLSGEEPAMWGPAIIGFGRRHYRYESGREGDEPIVGFAPRRANLVLYLACDFDARDAILARLGKHKAGRGCITIDRLADVNLAVLEELIVKSIAHARAAPAGW
jgi:hypothetical protein